MMSDEPRYTLPGPTCEFLAETWLRQQDLHGKSAVEIANMYCSALVQIWEKYTPPKEQPKGRRVIHPGIQHDAW